MHEGITLRTGPANSPKTFTHSKQNVCGFPREKWSQVLGFTQKQKYYFKKIK